MVDNIIAPFVTKDTTGNHRFQERGYKGIKAPKRNLILWQVPHLGNDRYIEMYVNPQGIAFTNRKTISSKRTKGGFIMQYWGEELEAVNINGITGDGGIEALNALFDVYRSEQLAFIEIADKAASGGVAGADSNLMKRRQPLAPLAASVVMWYMGQGRRGYFMDMQYDENTNLNGTLSYRMTFSVVETVGIRKNFMPWHRKPWSTTETPNIASNGNMVVTGGYPGENTARLGKLNSPVGKVELETVETTTPAGQTTTETRRVWRQQPLFDPKYWQEDFVNPTIFPNQTENNEATTVGDKTTAEKIAATRASQDTIILQESAKEGANVEAVVTRSAETSLNTGLVEEEITDQQVEQQVATDSNIQVTEEGVPPTETTQSPTQLEQVEQQIVETEEILQNDAMVE